MFKMPSKLFVVLFVISAIFFIPAKSSVAQSAPNVFKQPIGFAGVYSLEINECQGVRQEVVPPGLPPLQVRLFLQNESREVIGTKVIDHYTGSILRDVIWLVQCPGFEVCVMEQFKVEYTFAGDITWELNENGWYAYKSDQWVADGVPESIPCWWEDNLNVALLPIPVNVPAASPESIEGDGRGVGMRFIVVETFSEAGTLFPPQRCPDNLPGCVCAQADGSIISSSRLACESEGGIIPLRKSSGIVPELKGNINVTVESVFNLNVLGDNNEIDDTKVIDQATINLYKQTGFIRKKLQGESDVEYEAFLKEQPRALIQSLEITPDSAGRISFKNVPILKTEAAGGPGVSRIAYYTIEATAGETEEVDINLVTIEDPAPGAITTFFTTESVINIKPEAEEPFDEVVIQLTPIDEIGVKTGLVNSLSEVSPNNYLEIENLVQGFLNTLVDKENITPEELEAVKRAILAERVALEGARFSDLLLTTMLDGLANLLTDAIDDLFKSNRGKELSDARDNFNSLEQGLNFDRLEAGGWRGFFGNDSEVANRIKANLEEMLSENKGLGLSLVADTLKLASDGVFALISQLLTSTGTDSESAQKIASIAKSIIDTGFVFAITQGFDGGKPIAKFIISEIVKGGKDALFDGQVFYSYTGFTKAELELSLQMMEGWNINDKLAFESDKQDVFGILNAMGESLVVADTIVAFSSEIADALGGFGVDFIEVLGPVGATVAKVAKVVKYVSNGATFGVPFVMVYGVIGGPNADIPLAPGTMLHQFFGPTVHLGLMEKGVVKSFGNRGPADLNAIDPQVSSAFVSPKHIKKATAANQNLISGLNQNLNELKATLGQLINSLSDDIIPDAISLTGGETGNTFTSEHSQFQRSVSHIRAQVSGAGSIGSAETEGFQSLIESEADFNVLTAELFTLFPDLYFKVLLFEYTGPDDPLYIAERNHLISTIESFQNKADKLSAVATTVFNAVNETITLPTIVVDNMTVTSDVTGGSSITLSPEEFTLRAHIKNISALSVSDVFAKLTVASVQNAFKVSTPLERSVADGSLEADDGADLAGKDEADVVWQFTFNGDLDLTERVALAVELNGKGGAPGTFTSLSGLKILELDISLSDKDLDGIPDEYENRNGLDDTKDDALEDKDNDGLVNRLEFDIRTDPQKQDTDGDGLFDGEETTAGKDGFLTDPLNPDTDEDGIQDGKDGSPLDGGTTEPPKSGDIIGEPEVSIDGNEVTITREAPLASVKVTNRGDAILVWSAMSDNESIVLVSPNLPELRNGDGDLIISASPGFDFNTSGVVKATVRVFDIAGKTSDFKDITVKVGSGEDRELPDNDKPAPVPDTTPKPPSGKSFSFKCGRDIPEGPVFQLEKLILKKGETESCILSLTNFEPDNAVEILTNLKAGLGASISVNPEIDVTDANGNLKIAITAIKRGIDWVSWATPNEEGKHKFNKDAYNNGFAWGMFVEVR